MELDLDLLRTFVTISELKGFSAAADALGRTQPAVSLQIKRLECRLGCSLFRRTGRSVALTASGHLLLDYARRIFELHDEAFARLTSPDLNDFIRLGILEELATSRLPRILQTFATLYPKAKLQVQVQLGNDLVAELAHGRLDLVVASGDGAQPGTMHLWNEPLVWAASSRMERVPMNPIPLVLLPDPSFYRRAAVKALAGANLRWDPTCTSSTMTGVRAAVIAGIGVTVVGQSELTPDLRGIGPEEGLPSLSNAPMVLYYNSDDYTAMGRSLAVHMRRFAFD
ncbi:MAG: LysR substrate-binding domain-containing protein [Pararhizobium sp.]